MFPLISRTKSLPETLSAIADFIATHKFAHVISLNPENFVEASENAEFQSSYTQAELIIADGTGIIVAAHILGIRVGERITGVDLIAQLVRIYPQKRILFVGAYHDAATQTLEHFACTLGVTGSGWKAFPDVDKNDPQLVNKIINEKPDIIFIAFGSPAQELWIEKHKQDLTGVVCIGVGQAFDVYGGIITRAPQFLRALGLEWLYRLITQPWRWRRQLRLFKFIYLVIRHRILAR